MTKRLTRIEANVGEAARLGAELRDARQALGLTIEDVSASLRIRRVYLAALEDGRVRDLPAPAYAVGFVRTYARALGLADDEMVRRFREYCGQVVAKKTDLVFPEPVPDRGVPAGAVVLLGAVLAVGAYVAWYQWSGTGTRTVDAVPPPPPAIEQALRDSTPPPLPVLSGAASGGATAPGAPAAPGGTAPAAPGSPAAASGPVAIIGPRGAAPAPGSPAVAPGTAQVAIVTPNALQPPAAPANRIELRAKSDVWVAVRDRNGPQLVNRTLRAGETFSVPNRDGLSMSVGNINNLEIMVDGAPSAGFVPGAPSRRDFALDAERLKTTRIPAPPPPAPRPRPAADPNAAPAPQ